MHLPTLRFRAMESGWVLTCKTKLTLIS